MKTKEQLAKEYSNSVIDKIRKDRKEDPSHNIGYGDISEIAYKIGFDAGAKQMQEKIIKYFESNPDVFGLMNKWAVISHIQNLMRQSSGDE